MFVLRHRPLNWVPEDRLHGICSVRPWELLRVPNPTPTEGTMVMNHLLIRLAISWGGIGGGGRFGQRYVCTIVFVSECLSPNFLFCTKTKMCFSEIRNFVVTMIFWRKVAKIASSSCVLWSNKILTGMIWSFCVKYCNSKKVPVTSPFCRSPLSQSH